LYDKYRAVLLIAFAFSLMGGFMAKSFGRRLCPWFWLSIPLPLITCIVLLCLSVVKQTLTPSEEASRPFNPLSGERLPKQYDYED
jgi:uncharacterized protein (DUF983 family)